MNKAETVQRFKSAQDIELEAQIKAQALADATAVEFEQLANSMHDMINMMSDVLVKIMQSTNTTTETANKSAILLKETTEKVGSVATRLQISAQSIQNDHVSLFRRWLVAVVLAGIVGSV